MGRGFDRELLESPYEDHPDRAGRMWAVLAVIAVAVVVIVGAAALVVRSGEGDATATPDTPSSNEPGVTSPSSTTTTTEPEVALESWASDEGFLYHPTVLPTGWDACRIVTDIQDGDRFCFDEDEAWIQVSLEGQDRIVGARSPVGGDSTGEWIGSGMNELAFPAGFMSVVVLGKEVDPSVLVDVGHSIPLVSDMESLYPSYEVRIDLLSVRDGLEGLLGEDADVRQFEPHEFGLQMATPVLSLEASYTDEPFIPLLAPSMSHIRLVEAERPLVVGTARFGNRATAVWDQVGYGWRLTGQATDEEIAGLAIAVMSRIDALSDG